MAFFIFLTLAISLTKLRQISFTNTVNVSTTTKAISQPFNPPKMKEPRTNSENTKTKWLSENISKHLLINSVTTPLNPPKHNPVSRNWNDFQRLNLLKRKLL